MNVFWTILFLTCSFGLEGQQLIDVVADHDIHNHQVFTWSNTSGMSFFDFDEDGWDDLTYPMHNDSILFYKNVNGTLTKIDSYIYAEGTVRQMLWVDYDNNGTLDLFITYEAADLKLYKNDGNFNFTEVSVSAGLFPSVSIPYGFSFVDTDHDHDLDLYLCSYCPTGSKNKYYENQGDGTFIDKSALYGLGNGTQSSFMGVWFDYNNDQEMDLHIINDRIGGSDALYVKDSITYIDIADSMGILNPDQNPMTSSIADYNNDGFQDIFITDFGVDTTASGNGPYHYKLFENQNGASFIDKAAAKNLNSDIFGWGALWVDYNNDSYEDIYVATGNNFGELAPTMSSLYRNEGGGTFTLINDSIIGDIETFSFCPVKGDLNNDGFYDIAVLNKDTLPNLLQNQGNGNNYIKITPVGIISNRMAIGSQIRVSAGGINQLQTVFCGENLFAQNSQHKIFGLDTNSIIDSISIVFPSGIIAKRYNIAVNQSINIYEEEFVLVDFDIDVVLDPLMICGNDTISITLSGYDNYYWSDGSSDSVLVITSPGTYYFEAFNEMGDTLYRSQDIIVAYDEVPLYQESVIQVDCNNDFTGTASLIFANPTQIDSVFWSNGEIGLEIDSLPAGLYSYTITTNNGCNYYGSITVSEMENFYLEIQTTAYTSASPGSISLFVFGGTLPITYILDGDTVTNYISDLNAGSYTLTVIDGNGCIQEEIIYIEDLSTVGIVNNIEEFGIFIHDDNAKIFTSIKNIESIELYNMSGARLADLNEKDWHQKEHFIELEFPHPSGMYMLVFRTPQSVLREKVLNP
jgi:hypothetical protein